MPDFKRIEREIRLCRSDQDTSVTVEPINDDLCHLHGKIWLYIHWYREEDGTLQDDRARAVGESGKEINLGHRNPKLFHLI